jgi:pimeloyl-ACP methyl ester carboxylesterase
MARLKFPFLGESQVLDAGARSHAPGRFVELPDGMVHYEMAGPSEGQPVVLLNNLSHPYYIWDSTFTALAEAGFRVLRYDLYGRGYSDRPDGVHDRDLFERQFLNLISALGIDRPVDLVGLSLGAAMAVVFTDRHPAMIRKLCLVSAAGFVRKSFYIKLLCTPVLGELIMNLPGILNGFPEKARPQTKYAGFRRSYLSSVRHAPIFNLWEAYEGVGKQNRPVLVIWGRRDPVHTAEAMEPIKKLIPHVEFHAIDSAQDPQIERPEVVNPLLIEFLRK